MGGRGWGWSIFRFFINVGDWGKEFSGDRFVCIGGWGLFEKVDDFDYVLLELGRFVKSEGLDVNLVVGSIGINKMFVFEDFV